MGKRKSGKRRSVQNDDRLFTLEVSLFSGPMTQEFAKQNKAVLRTIQIRGDQTLEELHDAIYDAFDRSDEHLYEYQIGGKRPMDPKGRRYGLGDGHEGSGLDSPDLAGDVTDTTIGSLGLKVDDAFGYWFDFGDDWWHQISVASIDDKAPRGEYPKVTKRVGKSPPQHVDWDEEDDQ